MGFNPLNAELNPTDHLLALLGAHHIFHVSGLRVKLAFEGLSMEEFLRLPALTSVRSGRAEGSSLGVGLPFVGSAGVNGRSCKGARIVC